MAYSGKEKTETFDLICERIAEGESLRSVLRSENMPTAKTFYEWIDSDPEMVKQYARATELRAEVLFEDALNIADSVGQDIIEQPDGTLATNHNVINRDRLRIDTRKWFLSKIMPKKYGDKLELDNKHSGELTINDKIITTLTPEQLKESLKK